MMRNTISSRYPIIGRESGIKSCRGKFNGETKEQKYQTWGNEVDDDNQDRECHRYFELCAAAKGATNQQNIFSDPVLNGVSLFALLGLVKVFDEVRTLAVMLTSISEREYGNKHRNFCLTQRTFQVTCRIPCMNISKTFGAKKMATLSTEQEKIFDENKKTRVSFLRGAGRSERLETDGTFCC